MAELDKTISVIESWLKQVVLTPPPIKELYDALDLLKEQEELLKHEYWRGYNNGRADERGLQEDVNGSGNNDESNEKS